MPTPKIKHLGDPMDYSTWKPKTPKRHVYLGDPADSRPHRYGLAKGGVLVGKFRTEDEAWDYLLDAERRGLTRKPEWWGPGVDPAAEVVVDKLEAFAEAVVRQFVREALMEGPAGAGVTADPTTGTSGGARDYELERGVDIHSYWYKSPGEAGGPGTDPMRPEDAEEYIGMKPPAPATGGTEPV